MAMIEKICHMPKDDMNLSTLMAHSRICTGHHSILQKGLVLSISNGMRSVFICILYVRPVSVTRLVLICIVTIFASYKPIESRVFPSMESYRVNAFISRVLNWSITGSLVLEKYLLIPIISQQLDEGVTKPTFKTMNFLGQMIIQSSINSKSVL